MPRLTQEQIARAESRLYGESLVPLSELAGLPVLIAGEVFHPRINVLMRWAVNGKNGCHLDVKLCPRRLAYVTSRAALARFAAEVEAATTAALPLPTGQVAGP